MSSGPWKVFTARPTIVTGCVVDRVTSGVDGQMAPLEVGDLVEGGAGGRRHQALVGSSDLRVIACATPVRKRAPGRRRSRIASRGKRPGGPFVTSHDDFACGVQRR